MLNWFKAAAKHMLIDFDATGPIPHNPTKGSAREAVVIKEFLAPYLPPRFSISSGLIVDLENNASRQQDIMIYDVVNSPVLKDLNSDKLLFPESVLATMEVKSSLTYDELNDIVKKSASVWGLKRSRFRRSFVAASGVMFLQDSPPPLCMGFCFEAKMALTDLVQRLRIQRAEVELGHALSMVCVLRDRENQAGVIVNVSPDDVRKMETIPSEASKMAIIKCESPGDALLHMYLILMEHLQRSSLSSPGPDLITYAYASGLSGTLHLPIDEFRGAYYGKRPGKQQGVPLDRLEELRSSIFTLKNQATDDQIVEMFKYGYELDVIGGSITDKETVFVLDNQVFDQPRPLFVYEAIRRRETSESTAEDEQMISKFIGLFRSYLAPGEHRFGWDNLKRLRPLMEVTN